MKIRINKKGQIGDAIDLFMTVSLFIILFLFFSFTFLAVSKAKEQQTSNLVKGVSLNTEVLSNLYYQCEISIKYFLKQIPNFLFAN